MDGASVDMMLDAIDQSRNKRDNRKVNKEEKPPCLSRLVVLETQTSSSSRVSRFNKLRGTSSVDASFRLHRAASLRDHPNSLTAAPAVIVASVWDAAVKTLASKHGGIKNQRVCKQIWSRVNPEMKEAHLDEEKQYLSDPLLTQGWRAHDWRFISLNVLYFLIVFYSHIIYDCIQSRMTSAVLMWNLVPGNDFRHFLGKLKHVAVVELWHDIV